MPLSQAVSQPILLSGVSHMHVAPSWKNMAFWLVMVLLGFVTVTALFADLDKVQNLLLAVPPSYMVIMLCAVLFNYVLRFGKWCLFLRQLDLHVPWRDNVWVFFSAFTMVLSPAKLGEVVKSLFLKGRFGYPVARTAPIVMAERVTDLLGLLILTGYGWSRFAYGGATLVIMGLLLLCGILLLSRKFFWSTLDRRVLARIPRLAGLRRPLQVIEESTVNLFSLRSLALTVPLSALSWAGEGFALYIIFLSLQVDLPELLGISLFGHAFSSIVGALSFLPGGLLVTEGTLGAFFLYVGIGKDAAISATLLIRAVTLWFAVLLGTVVFLLGRRQQDLGNG